MTFLRPWFRRVFGPYMKNLSVKETEKYLAALRLTYFFSAGGLCLMLFMTKREHDQKQALLTGEPAKNPGIFSGRQPKDKLPSGIMYEYKPGKGISKIYFDKDEYYKHLEEMAYQKAKEDQEKAIAEGHTLPEGAINLVK